MNQRTARLAQVKTKSPLDGRTHVNSPTQALPFLESACRRLPQAGEWEGHQFGKRVARGRINRIWLVR